jgi:hypothetical protein
MSFGDHVILWLHVTAAIFTIGPGTAAIMSTPRYIRKRNPVVVGYLFRTTRIYSVAALLTLIFGLILAGMTHKFSQWWISASLTLFVVAFVLLVIILRDQRKALTALDAAEGAAVADANAGADTVGILTPPRQPWINIRSGRKNGLRIKMYWLNKRIYDEEYCRISYLLHSSFGICSSAFRE